MNLKEKIKCKNRKFFYLGFIVIAALIIALVLFRFPQPGVADQGDFDRVMTSSGLTLLEEDKINPDFNRFYNYTVTNYQIKTNLITGVLTIVGSSMGYAIALVSYVCNLLGSNIFKTQYLALVYGGLYIFAMILILRKIGIKDKVKWVILSLAMLFVLLDGNYLLWFNSLYGEPMMIVTLTLFIGTVLNYINHKYVEKSNDKLARNILFVLGSAFLFLGSKMQVIMSLPFLVAILVKILWDNKSLLSKKTLVKLVVLLAIIIIYPMQMNMTNKGISKDTQYNSVFNGVLKGSETPEQDLIDMGLNPEMAVEAGKHSYLDKSEYVKYLPNTKITEEEFYSKMSNGKLAKFYLTHPKRLIEGMEYTASKAFITSTSLGKYSREYSEEPVREFNRFTTWSNFREKYLPTKLWFVASIFILMAIVSVYLFVKNKKNDSIKNKIMLLWVVMFIGAIQFPMPFVGNGQADTAKQLYLFNFVFDIMLVVALCWCCFRIIDLLKKRVRK